MKVAFSYFRNLRIALVLSVAALSALSGCASVVGRASRQFADNLTAGILEQDDPGTARDGIPAYLLLIDGMIHGDEKNAGMLEAGARLYGAYAGGFVEEPERAQHLAKRAFEYARRAVCLQLVALCNAIDAPFDAFGAEVARVDAKNVGLLYTFATTWAGRIQTNSGDYQSIAEIPKVQALLERVAALAPDYRQGEPYMYLGVLSTLRPASLGGQPEQGKAYFEKALALSNGKNQMARVLYAQYYARLVFDRELHDRLLNEAIAADPHAPGLTLVNTLAQRRAKALLASGNDYF